MGGSSFTNKTWFTSMILCALLLLQPTLSFIRSSVVSAIRSSRPLQYQYENFDVDLTPQVVGPTSTKNDPEWQFFDTARIHAKGGDGGNGCVSFRREKGVPLGGPNGGNGGKGGSVHLVCYDEFGTLSYFRTHVHFKAEKGSNGMGKSRTGPCGSDIHIRVPKGTVVRDFEGNLAGELTEPGQKLCVAAGGRGGRGNESFKTQRNKSPKLCEKGQEGAERWISLELKLLADVGFIGVPNAGKSTLLSAVTNARPKIADYPFTTVVPNLGMWDGRGDLSGDVGDGLVLADIPGLLEGAHTGRGLGMAFLRHVERCRILVHVVSGASPDPVGDFLAINQELELFNPKMKDKMQVVVLNKVDLPEVSEQADDLKRKLVDAAGHSRVMEVSAATGYRAQELMSRVFKVIKTLPVEPLEEGDALLSGGQQRISFESIDNAADDDFSAHSFKIETDPDFPGQFRVRGARIERVAAMTNWEYYEAVERFKRIMDAMKITKALEKRGAVEGDLIMINDMDFDFAPASHGIESFVDFEE